MTEPTPHFRSGGARALVALHEQHLRAFLEIWQQAQRAEVTLPETDDPSYTSREHLLHHVLRAARGYLVWTCDKLGLPDPGIEPAPDVERIEAEAERYLERLIEGWRSPLAGVEKERLREVHTSNWGLPYSIDGMLEHAVMHPIRHRFQLENLLREQGA